MTFFRWKYFFKRKKNNSNFRNFRVIFLVLIINLFEDNYCHNNMIIIIRKLDNYKTSFFCSFPIMLHIVHPCLSMAVDVGWEVGGTGVITSLLLSPHIIMLPPSAVSKMAVGEDWCLVFNYKKIVYFAITKPSQDIVIVIFLISKENLHFRFLMFVRKNKHSFLWKTKSVQQLVCLIVITILLLVDISLD